MSNGVKITEHFAQRIASTIRRVEAMPDATGSGKIPTRFEDRPFAAGGTPIRLGQFTGPWPNEPGATGVDNLKPVKLYVQPSDSDGANDWVPELDGDGDEVLAITLNLFSYIPTRSGNDSYMWCSIIPISENGGQYWTGAYNSVDGEDVPVFRPYSSLWLLLAAEC